MFTNVSASIVLAAAKFTFIYLELDTWAANLDRVINKILSTDIAEEVVPVYCCFGRYLHAGEKEMVALRVSQSIACITYLCFHSAERCSRIDYILPMVRVDQR